jgi:membrane protein implicated in regulation of membrane protease activity
VSVVRVSPDHGTVVGAAILAQTCGSVVGFAGSGLVKINGQLVFQFLLAAVKAEFVLLVCFAFVYLLVIWNYVADTVTAHKQQDEKKLSHYFC